MFTLNCRGRILVIDKPLVMGIINATPDSFFSGSRYQGSDAILSQAEKMLKEGATIIDLGGQSTRPGSAKMDRDEELKRVIAPLEALHKNFPEAVISIDTYHSTVAAVAISAGASLVNDISAGGMDPDMISIVSGLNVPYVCMHMKGTPEDMQRDPFYENVTKEVLDFLIVKVKTLHDAGIHDIIIDPGFGFGKTIANNFELLRNLSVFRILECPLLLGVSRKSTIYKTLETTVDDALNGTTVLNTVGLMNGANILRVHDVRQAVETIKLVGALMDS